MLEVVTPSLTLSVITDDPVCPAAGVTLTVRLAPLPLSTIALGAITVGFELLLLRTRLVRAVSTSPMVKFNGPVVPLILIVWFAIPVMLGASFTAFTVNTKLLLAAYCPSVTLTVIIAVPL